MMVARLTKDAAHRAELRLRVSDRSEEDHALRCSGWNTKQKKHSRLDVMRSGHQPDLPCSKGCSSSTSERAAGSFRDPGMPDMRH